MKIGALARATGVDIETIRYYERIGLLPAPERQPNGYRAYGHNHLERLSFIRHCRALDMPLSDIRLLLDFMADAPVSPARPEDDRAFLSATRGLGLIASRGVPSALEALLDMTGEDAGAPAARALCPGFSSSPGVPSASSLWGL